MRLMIPTSRIGSTFLYDSKTGRSDLLGHVLALGGVPLEVMDGYVGPSDLLQAILIYQEVDAKDTTVAALNSLIKRDSTFTDLPAVVQLAMMTDAACEAGALEDPLVQQELREQVMVTLGVDIEIVTDYDWDKDNELMPFQSFDVVADSVIGAAV